jgi:hypothetical protein
MLKQNMNFFLGTLIGSLSYFIDNLQNLLQISSSEIFLYSIKAMISAIAITSCKLLSDVISQKLMDKDRKDEKDE